MKRHKWENDTCTRCGLKREKRHPWVRSMSVLRHGVWVDKNIYADYPSWWYGPKHGFVRPDCISCSTKELTNMRHHVFSAEFIRHFTICNQYSFRRPRYKRMFYAWKSAFLVLYGTPKGHDYQSWCSWFCGSCESKVSDKDIQRCSGKQCGGDWAGTHEHILQRFELRYEPDEMLLFPGRPNSAIFHIPTAEYRYKGPVHAFESALFTQMRNQCLDKIGLKIDKAITEGVDPFESLKWLIRYCREHKMIPYRARKHKEADLPF